MATSNALSACIALALGFGAFSIGTQVYQAWEARWKLRHIPSVGQCGILLSYFGASRYFKDARGMIQEGYEKYKGNVFKIPTMARWIVIVSGRDRVEELRRATIDQVSFRAAVNESIQIRHTLGPDVAFDPYHIAVVRTPLTRNLGIRFQDLQDEIAVGFAEHMPATDDWSKIHVLHAIMQITCRTSNRLFVGLPLCRNEDYRKLNIDFTIHAVKAGSIIGLFPDILRPLVARCLTDVSKSIDEGMKHLGPMIQERLDKDAKYGTKWEGRPNDLVSWLLETAQGPQRDIRNLAKRVLTVNFAAIHTTSITFTQVLFDLAMHPEYIPDLREEIEALIRDEGLTKASLLKLVKVDSFIKESQRFGGIAACQYLFSIRERVSNYQRSFTVSMQRKVLKDFEFSDGLVIPKGTFLAVATSAMHSDENHYSDPDTFDGYRFLKMGTETDEFNKHSMVTLGTDYIVFGHGRHACPGRFFAVNEMKAFIAHLLLNYDIMLDPEARPFKNLWMNHAAVPDPSATLLVRKRAL